MWISRAEYEDLIDRIEKLEKSQQESLNVRYSKEWGWEPGTWFGMKRTFPLVKVVASIANHLGFTAIESREAELVNPLERNKVRTNRGKIDNE